MDLKTYTLEKDIQIFYVEADSFPRGISDAHQRLHNLLSDSGPRTFFGISRPGANGVIDYKAGSEEKFEGEGKLLHCKTMLLKKGTYYSIYIKDYTKRMESISEAFQIILAQRGLDHEGYCVEMYEGTEDVRCMVRQKDHSA